MIGTRRIVITAISTGLGVLIGFAASSCDLSKKAPGKGDPNPRPPYNSAPAQVKPENVKPENVAKLCDFFHARPHEVLLTAEAEGNVRVYAELSGVPQELRTAATAYYTGEALSGNTPNSIDTLRRATLDAKYKTVIDRCTSAGWRAP